MTTLKPLDLTQLKAVRDAFCADLTDGLAHAERPIRALPAYLGVPKRGLSGEALVVDTGGTQVRAAWLRLGDTVEVLAGPLHQALSLRHDAHLGAEAFFASQAELALQLGAPKGLPVGYCFSYPTEMEASGDARLIRWTKGIDLPELIGKRVGEGLMRALAPLEPASVWVLNDTVAALLAASASSPEPAHCLGLIAGTGTNIAIYASKAPKLADLGLEGPQAINLESGNFDPPGLSPVDAALDLASETPGQQRFEKAVAGYYLPFLYALLRPQDGLDPKAGSGALVARIEAKAPGHELAQALLDRSADLIAAKSAGAASVYPGGARLVLLAEGGLFWKAPGYAERVEKRLEELALAKQSFVLKRQDQPNLVGAAAAAIMASSLTCQGL